MARAGLGELIAEQRQETYVVPFFVYDEEDDPRSTTVTMGTNTASRVEFALNQPTALWKAEPVVDRLGAAPLAASNDRNGSLLWLEIC